MGNWVTISTAGASGYTPPPAAPNITSASCSAYYGLFGNLSAYGLQGTITLPTGDAAYSHLKEIGIAATFPDGSGAPVGTLYAAFSGGTVTFKGPCSLPQADSPLGVTLTFTCKNDAGIATASPVTATVTVQAAAVSAVAAVDASTLATGNSEYHARFQDSATALHTVINVHVSMAAAQYPQTATLWINKQDGNGPLWQGWWKITGAGQLVQIGLSGSNTAVYPPGGAADGSWLVIGAAGAIPAEAGVPGSAVTSSPFTVPTIPVPAANAATAAWIDQINYGNNGQVNTWGWNNLFTTLPYGDPNFFFGRWTVQNGSLVGGVFTPGTAANAAQHDGLRLRLATMTTAGMAQPSCGSRVRTSSRSPTR